MTFGDLAFIAMFLRNDRMERKEESNRILEALMCVKNGLSGSKTNAAGTENLLPPSPVLPSRLARSPSPRPIMPQHRAKKMVDLAVSHYVHHHLSLILMQGYHDRLTFGRLLHTCFV